MNVWYSRPVFFVESVERSIAFYTDKLGFAEASRCEGGRKILVGQVNRDDCEILLNCQQSEKTGRGRTFISIDKGPFQMLRAECEDRGADSPFRTMRKRNRLPSAKASERWHSLS
jgi:catechol 2,3-dioxygenase-like lactoylglutathione lyase family enzyme